MTEEVCPAIPMATYKKERRDSSSGRTSGDKKPGKILVICQEQDSFPIYVCKQLAPT